MQYKMIDGQLYKTVDTAEINNTLNYAVEAARPYVEGITSCEQQIALCNQKIAQCEQQIADYKAQVQGIVTQSGLDVDAVKLINPDKANFLKL